jgi:hypothetical protein
MVFVLAATSIVCMRQSFVGNMWSETAAILGYSGAGKAVALPALVKTLKCLRRMRAWRSLALMMLYAMLMAFIMLVCSI